MGKQKTEVSVGNDTEENSEKKENRKIIRSLAAGWVVFMGMGVFFSVLNGFLGAALGFDSDSGTATSLFNSLAYIAAGILISLIVYKDNGLSLKSAISFKRIDVTVIIAAVLGINALKDILITAIALVLSNITTSSSSSTEPTVALFIEAVLIGPPVEEILFRFAGFGLLRDRLKKWTLCIGISLVFTVGHFYGIQGFVSVMIFSMIVCCIYYRFSNMVYPIGIHMLYNASGFLYEENTQLFGSQLATYKNGFYIYSAPLMIIQAVVLIAVLVYWRVYYVPKYCAVVENA